MAGTGSPTFPSTILNSSHPIYSCITNPRVRSSGSSAPTTVSGVEEGILSGISDDTPKTIELERFWGVVNPNKQDEYDRKYRSDAPPNRALVFIHCGVLKELCRIGREFDWLLDWNGEDFEDYIGDDFNDLPSGAYIWEGRVITTSHYSYLDGADDCDHELDGEFRPATLEEWKAYTEGEYPWDPNLWYEWVPPEEKDKEPKPTLTQDVHLGTPLGTFTFEDLLNNTDQ